MASRPWAFICPSSRGIGHALTRQLLLKTSLPILATARQHDLAATKETLLKGLGTGKQHDSRLSERLHLVRCDVTDEESIKKASNHATELFSPKTHHLHLACVMPGILHAEKSPAQVTQQGALESFQVNAIGPLLVAKHFANLLPRKATKLGIISEEEEDSTSRTSEGNMLQQLPKHATWLSMAARVGSTTDNRSGGWYSYRASKAAVFSLMRSLDLFLQTRSGDQALAVAYHPGTVRTDFTREYWRSVPGEKLFSTEYAVEQMLRVICRLRLEERGKCLDWRGVEVPP